jgi:hypothetical protein
MAYRHDNKLKSLVFIQSEPGRTPVQSPVSGTYAQAKRGASSNPRCLDPMNGKLTRYDHKLVLGRPSSYWLVGGEV